MTKDRLRRYRANAMELRQLRAQIEEIQRRAYAPQAQRFAAVSRSQRRRGGSRQERLADRALELLGLYEDRLERLQAEQYAIELAIGSLSDPRQRVLLRHRYIEGLTWEKVCRKMHYSYSQIDRLHAAALQEIREF